MSTNPYKDQVKRYKMIKTQLDRVETTLSKMADCYEEHGQNKHADYLYNLYKIIEAFKTSMAVFRLHMMEGDKSCLQTEYSENSQTTEDQNSINSEASSPKD